ncbi:unnamed protein product [Rhodiola kirilowii]
MYASAEISTKSPLCIDATIFMLSNKPLFKNSQFALPALVSDKLRLATCRSVVVRCSSRTEPAGRGLFTETSSGECDVDYLGESTKGDLNLRCDDFDVNNQDTLKGPIGEVARMEAEKANNLLTDLDIKSPLSARYSPRGIFCTRT